LFPEISGAIKIFFSYAHEDNKLRDKLAKHLGMLKREGLVEDWYDRQIIAGAEWAAEIDERLNAAHVILLLVSADFIASDYCYGIEMGRALERHRAGEACVIPVILRAVDWGGAPFGALQALPTGARAVTSWPNRDEAFADITRGIRAAVEKLRAGRDDGRPGGWSFQVPRMLPYLCDRSDQELELGPALSRHMAKTPRRPFLLVVHGDEDECHSEFLERLQEVSLPTLLNLKTRGLSVEDYTLQWPSSIRPGYAAETFQGLLGLSLHGNAAIPPNRVLDVVPPGRPVMLTVRLKTEDLAGGVGALSDFFKFWDEWPDLPVGRTLVCVVSVRHRRPERMGLLRQWRIRKVGRGLRAFIEGLRFDSYPNLCGVVLSELQAITHQQVVTWSQSPPVRKICRISEAAIDELFESRRLCAPGGPIPMQLLASELENLVKRYRL
jgi:TIR domain/inactive STAND